jgi:alpha-glucosidase
VLLLTLRGTPFVYQGDELGLVDADVPEDRVVDPGGRDGCRAPYPWDGTAEHGWPTPGGGTTWLPFPPGADTRNHAAQVADPQSILHLYRRALDLRRATPALQLGTIEMLHPPAGTLAYRRELGDDACTVLVNFTGEEVDATAVGGVGADVLLASDGTVATAGWSGVLGPDQAVVLRG